jgi:hypothetical protein
MSENEKEIKKKIEVLIEPLSKFLASTGKAVAEAQLELDKNSINTQIFIENQEVLKNLDLKATWYHMPEINLELKMSLSVELQEEVTRKGKAWIKTLYSAPLNATYQRSFDYDVNGTSTIKAKIVSLPPPYELETTE